MCNHKIHYHNSHHNNMVDSKPPPHIFLWCHPRSVSSVFERSIRELKGVKVFYEAHNCAYYQGEINKPESQPENPITFESVDEKLLQPYPEYDAVFIRDHAYFIKGRYKKYISGEFSSFKHTFLIRDPRKSFHSFIRLSKEAGFHIIPEEYGFREVYDMYKVIKEGIDPNPVIVDADDLLNNPKEIMRSYCNATGLVYTDDMLTWTPGIVEDWKKVNPHYMIFHKAAMFSSGFTKPTDSTSPPMNIDELPTDVKEILQDAMTCYEEMYSARIKV